MYTQERTVHSNLSRDLHFLLPKDCTQKTGLNKPASLVLPQLTMNFLKPYASYLLLLLTDMRITNTTRNTRQVLFIAREI